MEIVKQTKLNLIYDKFIFHSIGDGVLMAVNTFKQKMGGINSVYQLYNNLVR